MAITSIPTLSDISRTPKIVANEVDKFNSLINKYTTLTTSGFQTFTSQSSGVTYNTVANGGETELLSILINAINANSSSPCIFTASHFNSIKTTLEAGAGSEVNADKLDGLHASDFAKLVGGNTFTGLQSLQSLRLLANGLEGGEFTMEKPPSGSSLLGNVIHDIAGNNYRIFDNGNNAKGAFLPLSSLAEGVGSEIITSTTGKAVDSDKLDGIDSAAFARKDINETYTNRIKNLMPANVSGGASAGDTQNIFIESPVGTGDAFMSFHLSGQFGVNFGVDRANNDLFYGGWSMGAVKNKLFHSGNYDNLVTISSSITLNETHNNQTIYCANNSSPITITFPNNLPLNFKCNVIANVYGNACTFAAGSGTNVFSYPDNTRRTLLGASAWATLRTGQSNTDCLLGGALKV